MVATVSTEKSPVAFGRGAGASPRTRPRAHSPTPVSVEPVQTGASTGVIPNARSGSWSPMPTTATRCGGPVTVVVPNACGRLTGYAPGSADVALELDGAPPSRVPQAAVAARAVIVVSPARSAVRRFSRVSIVTSLCCSTQRRR